MKICVCVFRKSDQLAAQVVRAPIITWIIMMITLFNTVMIITRIIMMITLFNTLMIITQIIMMITIFNTEMIIHITLKHNDQDYEMMITGFQNHDHHHYCHHYQNDHPFQHHIDHCKFVLARYLCVCTCGSVCVCVYMCFGVIHKSDQLAAQVVQATSADRAHRRQSGFDQSQFSW